MHSLLVSVIIVASALGFGVLLLSCLVLNPPHQAEWHSRRRIRASSNDHHDRAREEPASLVGNL
jgi:hypothetical protein